MAENEVEKRSEAEAQLEQMKQKTWTLREILDAMEVQLAENGAQLQAATEEKTRLLERLAHDGQLSLEVKSLPGLIDLDHMFGYS